jgi:hypothetical protein
VPQLPIAHIRQHQHVSLLHVVRSTCDSSRFIVIACVADVSRQRARPVFPVVAAGQQDPALAALRPQPCEPQQFQDIQSTASSCTPAQPPALGTDCIPADPARRCYYVSIPMINRCVYSSDLRQPHHPHAANRGPGERQGRQAAGRRARDRSPSNRLVFMKNTSTVCVCQNPQALVTCAVWRGWRHRAHTSMWRMVCEVECVPDCRRRSSRSPRR